MKVWLDTTSNIIGNKGIRKQIREQLKEKFKKELPKRMYRMGKVPSFLTTEVGLYSNLLNEAKHCYETGLYHATISMVGVTAERFAVELSEKMKFEINGKGISEKKLFSKYLRQVSRLILLNKSDVIKPETYEKLDKIRIIRNKYIHPKEVGDGKRDSLKILKLFIEVINSRFSDEYKIRNGKIMKR